MKIIVGLGNPGPEYANTRHNAGIDLVDAISKIQILRYKDSYGWRRKKEIMVAEFPDLVLIKSAGVFMNESGKMIHELRYMKFDLKDLFLAHDDLDIKLGEVKIHLGKGPKVHNGVNSVEEAMGTKEFWRIRIGIENRAMANTQSGEEYVLEKFSEEERQMLNSAIERTISELL